MSLANRLAEQRDGKPGPKCSMCRILVDLSDDERQAVEDAMASEMQSSAIYRALRAEGYEIRQATVGRHRRGDCTGL